MGNVMSSDTSSGHVGNLTSKQESALAEFKEAVRDIQNKPDDTNYFYLRWLRAGKFNVPKTIAMFQSSMENYWHRYSAHTILDPKHYTPPEMFEECLTGGYFGEDHDGHPVWYDNFGNLDPKGIFRSVWSVDEIHKYKCYHAVQLDLELKNASRMKGKHIETVTAVIDVKNLSQKHLHWPFLDQFRIVLKVLQANNPERIKKILIVNPPPMFQRFFKIVKHVLDKKIKNQLVICKRNSDIQKYISSEYIPAMYGGEGLDTDFLKVVKTGRDVPAKYWLDKQPQEEVEVDKERDIDDSTPALQATQETVLVSEELPDTESNETEQPMQWRLSTGYYDINVEVSLNKEEEDLATTRRKFLYLQIPFDYSSDETQPSQEFVSIKVELGQENICAKKLDNTNFSYRNVLTELLQINTEWRYLALTLGVSPSDVDTISYNHTRDVRRCVEVVVDKWFKTVSSPLSWTTLCSALRHPIVSRYDIARNIERKHNISSDCCIHD